MMEKDPVRQYGYSFLLVKIKKTSVRCLDCIYAEVSAKVKSSLGRDETVFFLFFNKWNIKPDLKSQSTTKTAI